MIIVLWFDREGYFEAFFPPQVTVFYYLASCLLAGVAL